MTDLSERERKLVEACQQWFDPKSRLADSYSKLLNALRAYDPPRKKKYTLEKWMALTERQRSIIGNHVAMVRRGDMGAATLWDNLREALATEEQ